MNPRPIPPKSVPPDHVIAERRHTVHAQMPELVPFISALAKCEMIDGWRDLEYAGPIRPENPKAVVPAIFDSFEKIKERSKNGPTR